MTKLVAKMLNRIRGCSLLHVRLLFHFIAFVHLAIVAVVTLSIDLTVDKDPAIKQYGRIRWKLITFWFNVLTLIYFPICLYCECQQKNGVGNQKHVRVLGHITDVLMTSILMPTITLADILFWSLMKTDVSLVAPPKLFDYLPVWCQHSLHTVSFVVMIFDLMLTPRRMPSSLLPQFAIGTAFFSSYTFMVYVSFQYGEQVYSFLELLTVSQHIMVVLSCYFAYTAFFLVGWMFISYFWSGLTHAEKID